MPIRLKPPEYFLDPPCDSLLRSVRMQPSPAPCTFGPNMMLAKELLEAGEREVVMVEACARFWQTPDHRADQWVHTIRQGGIPDFGPNLNYT